ncbi:MAG: glycoside-pentoside-hexuronide (GPH):cation symporter [Candidatus Ruminococcus intestinipullorum]|nr:glycoside-pentoside-hexuronide (GPH):cation symporter [Candidatus Ruminococcus intestinipullorum]
MKETKYLKWYQKFAYGTGDIAGNCGYCLMSSFIMLYLSNAVGLNTAIIGVLMMVSKIFDGFTDVLFGNLMDKTKSKLGKARPWMLFGQIGVSITLFLSFCIPNLSPTVQYIYFFIFYTAYNAIFYTANSISYAALAAKITKNSEERVQLGSIRFIFATLTTLVISYTAMGLVERFGGGVRGWRTVALIFSLIALVVNTFSVLMVKEVPDLEDEKQVKENVIEEKIGFLESFRLLFKNKYFLIVLVIYLINYIYSGITQGVGIYFMTYYMGNAALLGTFSLVSLIPVVIILSLTPVLVKKCGSMWKMNVISRIISLILGIGFIVAAMNKNLVLMLVFAFFRNMAGGPLTGTLNAFVAETSDYTWRTQKKRIDGVIFSCSSVGVKVGGGLGSALLGLMLELGGFDGKAAVQTASAINMIFVLYAVVPVIFGAILLFFIWQLKVEQANRDWDKEHIEGETV